MFNLGLWEGNIHHNSVALAGGQVRGAVTSECKVAARWALFSGAQTSMCPGLWFSSSGRAQRELRTTQTSNFFLLKKGSLSMTARLPLRELLLCTLTNFLN